MKSTVEVLSIFFISILFLFITINKNSTEIKNNPTNVLDEKEQSLTKNINHNATPIIIVKRD
jgi:hypothetical protein